MNDLFHRTAKVLEPIAALLMAMVATSNIVQADETPQRRQHTKKRAYLWTFLAHLETEPVIAYRFSADRSGENTSKPLASSFYANCSTACSPSPRESPSELRHDPNTGSETDSVLRNS